MEINRICRPDKHSTGIFFPYPGTKIHAYCEKEGLLKKSIHINMERREAVLDSPGFSKKEIQKSYVWFDYYVYKGTLPLYKLIIRVIALKFKSNPFFNLVFRKIVRIGFLKKVREKLASRN